jgi:hypothetical protein
MTEILIKECHLNRSLFVWLKEKELHVDTGTATRNSIKIFNNCGHHNVSNIRTLFPFPRYFCCGKGQTAGILYTADKSGRFVRLIKYY